MNATAIESLYKAKQASFAVADYEDSFRMGVLESVADALLREQERVLAENRRDCQAMPESDPKYDRLLLTPERIAAIARDIRRVAHLPSPIGRTLETAIFQNGLRAQKISVPLGVIGIIYEARPNVTLDAFCICFKAGSVAALKGGKDAQYSNAALADVVHEALRKIGAPEHALTLLPSDRASTETLLRASGVVDVIIPRGSQSLIDFVRAESRVPVIETGAGVVHAYFDASGDLEKGKAIILNAKTRRVSVCNALDTLLLHAERLQDARALLARLADFSVRIYADEAARQELAKQYPAHLLFPATDAHYGTEFLGYAMSVKTVSSLDEALDHIAAHSSRHSEAIIAENTDIIATFTRKVDSAVVYVNASTAFTDGGEFDMGAEIGISTQKLHARGPMGLREITSYKWIVCGDGHTRP